MSNGYERDRNPRGRPGNAGGRPPREDRRPSATLDTSRVVFGQTIDPRLYSDIAEDIVKAVGIEPQIRGANNASQLRRFYDEFSMIQERVGTDAERFRLQEPFIQMLKAKSAYALGRKKIDANFDALLCRVVDQSKDPDTLKQAKLFMEAFMAFYKVHGPREG